MVDAARLAEDLEHARTAHHARPSCCEPICAFCDEDWPCTTRSLVEYVDRLEAATRAALEWRYRVLPFTIWEQLEQALAPARTP